MFCSEKKYSVDLEDFESKIDKRTKLLLLSHPHNPVGKVWTKDELREIAEICIRNNVIIVSDEIHADLLMPDYHHIPMASISQEIAENTITCIAPSKTFNLASLASSAIIIQNEKLKTEFDNFIERLHLGMGNIFGITAMETAYTYGDEWLDELRYYLKGNYDFLTNYLGKNITDITAFPLEGTYLVWLDCRKLKMTDVQLKDFFTQKAKVGMNSGVSFGKGGEGFMRMNIACPRSTLEKALTQIKTAVESL